MGTFTNSKDPEEMMWHFIRVFTVMVKKIIRQKIQYFFNYNLTPLDMQEFFSGVSGAVIRPLSQWQMLTFFPNLNKKIPNQKVIFM